MFRYTVYCNTENMYGMQVFAALSYIAYLAIAVYGATTVQIGMNYVELLPDDTRTSRYLADYGEHLAKQIGCSVPPFN